MAITFTERYVTATALGGGTGTQADPWTWDEALANVAAGDRVNVQAGTYNVTNPSCTADGNRTNPIVFRGYQNTIGDLDENNNELTSGVDVPVIVTTTEGGGFNNCDFLFINHIHFQGGPWGFNASCFHMRLNYGRARRCKLTSIGSSVGGNAINVCTSLSTTVFLDCHFKLDTTSGGYEFIQAADTVQGCFFEGTGTGHAVAIEQCADIRDCIFYNTGGVRSMWNTGRFVVTNCTFYNPTQYGVAITWFGQDYARNSVIRNCMFANFTKGVSAKNADSVDWQVDGCSYYNVATQIENIAFQTNAKTEDTDPFLDSANKDMRLSFRAAGYSKSMPFKFNGVENGRDVGAAQHADPQLSTGYTPTAGIQLFPFRQWVEDDFGVEIKGSVFHPLG